MRRLSINLLILLTILIALGCSNMSSSNQSITIKELVEKNKLINEGYYEFKKTLVTPVEVKTDITYIYRVWFKNKQVRIETEILEQGSPISVSGQIYSEEQGLIDEYHKVIKKSSYHNIGIVGKNEPVNIRELTFLKYIDDLDLGNIKNNSFEKVNGEECAVVEPRSNGVMKIWISSRTGAPTQIQYDNGEFVYYEKVKVGKGSVNDEDLRTPEQ